MNIETHRPKCDKVMNLEPIRFFVADAMGRRKYGIIALGVCTITGSIAGMIGALPTCLIFMIGAFLHKRGDNK